MPADAKSGSDEWRDGFLFVGNHVALDFVNTGLEQDGAAVELLPDAEALARWMEAAGWLNAAAAGRLGRRWKSDGEAGKEGATVVRFRERLRDGLLRYEREGKVPAGFLRELNELLAGYPMVRVAEQRAEGVVARTRFEPERPKEMFGPLAEATLELLTTAEGMRVRKCEGCPVQFLDVSKKGSRRWCSMQMCGNKRKVAAYQRRRREGNN